MVVSKIHDCAGMSSCFHCHARESGHLVFCYAGLCRRFRISVRNDMTFCVDSMSRWLIIMKTFLFPPSIGGNSGLPEWGMTQSLRCLCLGDAIYHVSTLEYSFFLGLCRRFLLAQEWQAFFHCHARESGHLVFVLLGRGMTKSLRFVCFGDAIYLVSTGEYSFFLGCAGDSCSRQEWHDLFCNFFLPSIYQREGLGVGSLRNDIM